MTLTPGELPFRKVRNIPLPGGSLDFGEFSASIILDEDMKAYLEMHDWMRRTIDAPLKGPLDRDDADIPSTADITLMILNSQNNKTKSIRYLQAMPTNLPGSLLMSLMPIASIFSEEEMTIVQRVHTSISLSLNLLVIVSILLTR